MASEVGWDEARLIAYKSFTALPVESVKIGSAVGRVVATDLVAKSPLPFYTTSAMDGWVTSGSAPWKIVGEIATGYLPTIALREGECARIGTGGIIPDGATAVIRWEHATESDGFISGETSPGKDIRPAGEECQVGELLVAAGTKLQPALVGNLAATGYDEVPVYRRPRIALLFLGDELIHEGLPRDGKIRDSLGVQIPAFLQILGCEIVHQQFVDDEYASLTNAVDSILDSVDVIVTTGGTADGPRDHIHPLLDERGADYLIDRVKARPGHPSLLAAITVSSGRRVAHLGLPGNPQSALVCITSLAAPLFAALQGDRYNFELATVKSAAQIDTSPGFNRLVAGQVVDGEFHPAEKIGSNMLRGLAHSTGFAVCEPGVTPVGGSVRWLPIPLY